MDLYSVRNMLNGGKTIFDIKMRVTFYARVSTDSEEQKNSLHNQIGYYREFIEKCPNWSYVSGYYDEGITGTSAKRRENFLRMIEDGKNGRFDLIITKEISRFSRNTLDSIKYTQELLAAGIGVLFQNDNINTLHSDSELRLTIMSSIAQDEVRKLSERVKFGLKRSISEGKVLGNENIYGYTKRSGRLVLEPTEATIVQRIFELYITGIGLRAIGSELLAEGITNRSGKEFGYSTIKRIIQNPKYKGYYCGNKSHKIAYNLDTIKKLDCSEWVLYKDEENIPQIIDTAIWERANEILAKRSREVRLKKTSYTNKYIYSKKIFCGEHNTAYYHAKYKYKNTIKHIWQCKQYTQKGLEGCSMPLIYQDQIDDIVRQTISAFYLDKTKISNDIYDLLCDNEVVKQLEKRLVDLQQKISEALKRKDRLLDLSIDGTITNNEFKTRNQRFNSEIDALNEKITEIKNSINANKSSQETILKTKNLISNELNNDFKITSDLVDSIIEKITVLEGSSKDNIILQINLKLFTEPQYYQIFKSKNTTQIQKLNFSSVCSS